MLESIRLQAVDLSKLAWNPSCRLRVAAGSWKLESDSESDSGFRFRSDDLQLIPNLAFVIYTA